MTGGTSDPTVQTPTGPPEGATGGLWVSLAEIDAMGRKAARGAGFTWGMAEEAGRAARWLAAWGLPGPELLLAALEAMHGKTAAHAPKPAGSLWRAPAGALCPLATGAMLCDRAAEIRAGARIQLAPLLFPLLILAPLCRAARDLDFAIAIEGAEVVATPDGPAADWTAMQAPLLDGLTIARTATCPAAPLVFRPDARFVPVDVWRGLDRLAHRTYVPATEASRQRGAGAGLLDND